MTEARAYYNEIDPDAVAALRQLIVEGVIAPGEVDTRSIKEVTAHDLEGFTQCHFFAGGGVWSYAARLAGWPDSRELWTGSCPCQPFSVAGERGGTDDPRHLWPDFHRLISARRPAVVMGEQVAGKAGYGWFDGVCADLARENFASRTVDIPACAVDAPHQRNRLYWIAVADTESICGGRKFAQRGPEERASDGEPNAHGAVAHPDVSKLQLEPSAGQQSVDEQNHRTCGRDTAADDGNVGNAQSDRRGEGRTETAILGGRTTFARANVRQRNGSWWADAEWIECHDGKARRAKPAIPLLVNGMVGRIGLWSLAGNSISPVLAAEVIGAFLDVERAP